MDAVPSPTVIPSEEPGVQSGRGVHDLEVLSLSFPFLKIYRPLSGQPLSYPCAHPSRTQLTPATLHPQL